MELLALVLMFFGIFAMVGAQVLIKKSLNHFGDMEVNVAVSVVAASFLVLWVISPFNASWNSWIPSHPDQILFWGALLIGALVNTAIRFATTKSYSKADLSRVAPIQAMTPGLIVVTAMLIGEFPSMMGYAGIVLIMVGTYAGIREGVPLLLRYDISHTTYASRARVVSWKLNKDYFMPLFVWQLFMPVDNSPLKRNWKEKGTLIISEEEEAKLQTRSALRWAYGSATMGTFGLLATGIMSRHGDVVFGNAVDQIITSLIFLFAFSYLSRNEKKVERLPVWERVTKYWPLLSLMGIFYALHMVFIISAFRLAPVAYIGSLKRISIFLTVLIAVFVLRETTMSWRRIGLASIIAIGAVLLALDPTQAVVLNSLDDYLIFLRR